MDSFECLVAFARALEAGSFSAAARHLGVSQPTVSKRIAAMERQFGVPLFARTTRKLRPTAEALRIYDHVRRAITSLDAARATVGTESATPRGTLRVAAPRSFGSACIVPGLGAYLRQNPGVSVDLHLTERPVDLIGEGIEVGVRVGPLPSSSLVARRIGTVERVVVASRAYMSRRAMPRSPEDLVDHQCIVLLGPKQANRWTFDSETGRHVVEVNGRLRVDDIDAVRDAMLDGLGVCLVPLWGVQGAIATGEAVVLLGEFHAAGLAVSAVYPDADGLSPRARSFIDFLANDFAEVAASNQASRHRSARRRRHALHRHEVP
jgi:DNA-binding transcriptional LysR family regulator